jgi:hypothetical protein
MARRRWAWVGAAMKWTVWAGGRRSALRVVVRVPRVVLRASRLRGGGLGALIVGSALMVALGSCAPAEPTCGHTGYGSLSHNLDSSGLPRDPVTEADMNAQPEAHLLLPGATDMHGPLGMGECKDLFTGLQEVYIDDDFLTSGSVDNAYAYYRAHLMARGWQSAGGVVQSGGDFSSYQTFTRGSREWFVVRVYTSSGWQSTWATPIPAGSTAMSTDFTIAPASP